MRLKKAYIFLCVVILLFIAATCLYFIPTKIVPIEINVDALKLDKDGNNLSTVPITINGTLTEYLFRDDRISIEISPIEDLYDIRPWETDIFNTTDIGQPNEWGFYSLDCFASSKIVGEDSFYVNIFFWDDMSKWQIFRNYRIGSNLSFEESGDYRSMNFEYRITIN